MAKYTRMGDRTKRIRIYRQATGTAPNADGQIAEDAELYATRWAKVVALQGNERIAASQVQANVNYRVRLPSDPLTRAITAKMWLLLEDDTRLNVTAAYDIEERRKEVELLCDK